MFVSPGLLEEDKRGVDMNNNILYSCSLKTLQQPCIIQFNKDGAIYQERWTFGCLHQAFLKVNIISIPIPQFYLDRQSCEMKQQNKQY